jgi:hypothetical protein
MPQGTESDEMTWEGLRKQFHSNTVSLREHKNCRNQELFWLMEMGHSEKTNTNVRGSKLSTADVGFDHWGKIHKTCDVAQISSSGCYVPFERKCGDIMQQISGDR